MLTTDHKKHYYQALLTTPLGSMIVIADENVLFYLGFADFNALERNIERLRQKTKSTIIPGRTHPITLIEQELNLYFNGELKEFKTSLCLIGSPFQKRVWQELQKIPFGQTCSYATIATAIGKPTAFRAVAQANSVNQFAIIIPCHRVINSNGDLGGYSSGLERKKWLIYQEKRNI